MYINEIIRITYKCNWYCQFCNVLKTNNFWEHDVSEKEILSQIFSLYKKYSKDERENLVLSFSGWEPTLNKKLHYYIQLAKTLWIGCIQIQTNGSILFRNFSLLEKLMAAWLDEIFLAQHSDNQDINTRLWSPANMKDFTEFLNYYEKNKLSKKVRILLNIVVSKINLNTTKDYISFLIKEKYFERVKNTHISIGFVQPNGYAQVHQDEVLLRYSDEEIQVIREIIDYCKEQSILLDFHFTSPPLCVLDYPEYNLEYTRLKELEHDTLNGKVTQWNKKSYEWLWKEKMKVTACEKCSYNQYCLWFYKNWVQFVWIDVAEKMAAAYQ